MGGCHSGGESDAEDLPGGLVEFSTLTEAVRLKVKFLRKIAEGGYSRVYLVTEIATKRLFALKLLNTSSEELLQQVNKEVEVMTRFAHPNLIRLVAHHFRNTSSGNQEALLLLPFYSLGTLEDLATKKRLSEGEVMSLFTGLCSGVAELHKNGLVHRDLKPLNVLLTQDNNNNSDDETGQNSYIPVICDLGSVSEARLKIENNREAMNFQEVCDRICSPLYRAPELFDVSAGSIITEKADVWALGCILYFMLFGEGPFHRAASEPGASIKLAVVNGKINYSPSTTTTIISAPLVSLMQQLLAKDPTQRPSVEEALLACSLLSSTTSS